MNRLQKETILFVDDETSILEIASEYFSDKGYQVITANNGLEATEVLKNYSIDCCLTDINMPEMDGLALAEYIRDTDNTIPVVVMTGYPSLDNTIKTLKNGVVDFLIKPVNLDQMELCVRRVLRERQLFVENIVLKKEVQSKARLEKLNKELLYKVEELNILNNIMSDFTMISSSIDVFKRVVDMGAEITHADEVRFFVINDSVKKPFEISSHVAHTLGKQKDTSPDSVRSSGDFNEAIESLIMEIASDEIPLLISDNKLTRGLPENILSFMVVPLKIREKVFGVLTASVKNRNSRFNEKDLYYLSFMAHKAAYAIENLALYENIYENLFSTLYAFVTAIEAKDAYTKKHSNRVAEISVLIGEEVACSKEDLDVLNFAGHLHDIGKIGVRDDILLKPGRLTPEEFETIKEHPVIGANIVGQLGLWNREQHIIRHHHEKYDGTGYPVGLKGEDIPFLSRILSVADAFDAMASDRAYRQKMPTEKVIRIIKECAGTQFDPILVDAFIRVYEAGKL
ncbi:MAG: response regulator [Proteobacteria bacterium]|nr:response regulator [Pseudomonadota bacterium]